MKKEIAILICSVLLSVSIMGCSNSENNSSASSSNKTQKEVSTSILSTTQQASTVQNTTIPKPLKELTIEDNNMEWKMNEHIKDVKSEYDGQNYKISGKIVGDYLTQADKDAYGYNMEIYNQSKPGADRDDYYYGIFGNGSRDDDILLESFADINDLVFSATISSDAETGYYRLIFSQYFDGSGSNSFVTFSIKGENETPVILANPKYISNEVIDITSASQADPYYSEHAETTNGVTLKFHRVYFETLDEKNFYSITISESDSNSYTVESEIDFSQYNERYVDCTVTVIDEPGNVHYWLLASVDSYYY